MSGGGVTVGRNLGLAIRADKPNRRRAALMGRPSGQWPAILEQFEEYRLGRLTAYLRAREPDDELHCSILVYRLSASDLARALEGPHPDYGPDDLAQQLRELPPEGE